MKKIILLFLLFPVALFAQKPAFEKQEVEINSLIKGTLFLPLNSSPKTKLVILIAGSGPTNRNGNSGLTQNNSLKFLAENLANQNIAVFSYDKRIIAMILSGKVDEKTLRFEDFINDAKDVVNYFKMQNKFSKIIIAGHSEGSLIGMIASSKNIDGYISIAGAGRPIDEVLNQQYSEQYHAFSKEISEKLALLKTGQTFEYNSKNPILYSILKPDLQEYLISWIKYNPQDEIKKVKVPTLIINGKKDIQVSVEDANLLKKAKPDATLVLIDDMNHIFKIIKGDVAENKASYSNPKLPVSEELISTITDFVHKI